jgi:hypothetical protein
LPRFFPSPDPTHVGASGTGSAVEDGLLGVLLLVSRWHGHVCTKESKLSIIVEGAVRDSGLLGVLLLVSRRAQEKWNLHRLFFAHPTMWALYVCTRFLTCPSS